MSVYAKKRSKSSAPTTTTSGVVDAVSVSVGIGGGSVLLGGGGGGGGGGVTVVTPSTRASSSSSDNRDDDGMRQSVPSFHRSHLPRKIDARRLKKLSAPHVGSFDYFLDAGLRRGVSDASVREVDVVDPSSSGADDGNKQGGGSSSVGHVVGKPSDTIKFWLENVKIAMPTKTIQKGGGGGGGGGSSKAARLYPRECRELGINYAAPLTADVCVQFVRRDGYGDETPSNGGVMRMPGNFGMMPIMVASGACHLRDKSPEQMVALKEEGSEFGGYFIVSGIERCVRLLQVPRSNHAACVSRSNYANRGRLYTDLGVAVRCQRHNGDMSTVTNTLHYLTTGGATLKFVARKQEFLLPVVLVVRALSGRGGEDYGGKGGGGGAVAVGGGGHGITDEELYDRIVQGDSSNTFVRARAELLLQEARQFAGMQTPAECLAFIGSRFRLLSGMANSTTDVSIGHYIIHK